MLLPYYWSAYFHSAQHLRVWISGWGEWGIEYLAVLITKKKLEQKRRQNMMYSCYNGGCHPSFVSVGDLFHFWKESPNGHIECASVKLQNNYTNTLFWSVFIFSGLFSDFRVSFSWNHSSSFVLTIPTIIGRGKLPLNVNRLKQED